jgi:DNA-binding response OmpR family regulator
MENLEQVVALVRVRLNDLLSRKESEGIRLELFRIAHEIDSLVGTPSDMASADVAQVVPTASTANVPTDIVRSDRNLILVADEDADQRAYLRQQLSGEFDIVEASNGGEAWEMAAQLSPDIIVSDVLLSVISGTELCQKIRGSLETSHIAFILLSALSVRENIIYGLEAGADDYITKPFDPDILRTRIHGILRRRQRMREEVIAKCGRLERIEYQSQLDREFMSKVFRIIESQISNTDFAISDLCYELAMSRSSVYNKIKTLTGTGPNDVIRLVRLSRAKELLSRRPYPIAEVAEKVGFADPKYFSTCFKKEFGVSPSKIDEII